MIIELKQKFDLDGSSDYYIYVDGNCKKCLDESLHIDEAREIFDKFVTNAKLGYPKIKIIETVKIDV